MSSEADFLEVHLYGSFEQFMAECSRNLYRTAFLLAGDRGQAEDLLQAALERVMKRWLVAKRNPTAYTRKVLVNLHHNAYRDSLRRPQIVYGSLTIEPRTSDTGEANLDNRDWMFKGLALLPARQREVIVLRFYCDLSVEDTADVMGTSEGTVKSHTARAYENLRKSLGQSDLEEDHVDTTGIS